MEINEPKLKSQPTTISGSRIVVGMIVLGIVGGSLCVGYAVWRSGPYLDLRLALAEEFPKSVPQIEAGRHDNSPMTLRIVLNIKFPAGDETYSVKTQQVFDRVVELVKEHQDLTPYKIMEVHLVHRRPQQATSRKTAKFNVADLL